MRCGKRSKLYLLLSVLLLCSSSLYSQAEIDPEGIYEISGTQLIELRDTLTRQETQLDALAQELETSRRTLIGVQSALMISERAIDELKTSLIELSNAVLSAEKRAGMFRSLSIVLGTTTAGGLVFMLATILGR